MSLGRTSKCWSQEVCSFSVIRYRAIQKEQHQKQQIRASGKALGTISSLSSILDEVSATTSKVKGLKKPKSTRLAIAPLPYHIHPSLPVKPRPARKRMRNATRQKILAREVSLFSKVLKHPAFKEDPCQTIATHLTNMLDNPNV